MKTQNNHAQNPSIDTRVPFVVNPHLDDIDAHDTVSMLLMQAHASVVALSADGQDLKEGFSLSQPVICNLLWSIQTQLEMAQAALNHMSEVVRAQSSITLGGVQ